MLLIFLMTNCKKTETAKDMLNPVTKQKVSLKSSQYGIALLEVMIAMLLFAISVIGYSQLQMKTIHEAYDGQQRAIAIRIASGLVDRMSANTSALDDYRDEIEAFDECPDAPVAACADTAGAAAVCTDSELAAYDVWYSFCGLDSGVSENLIEFDPSASCAGGACGPGTDMEIRLQWISKMADSNAKINAAAVRDQVAMTVRL